MTIVRTIQVAGIPIDIHDGPVSISFSGGADSSILLYILSRELPGPINVFTMDDTMKFGRNTRYSKQVFEWIAASRRNDMTHTVTAVPEKTRNALLDLWASSPGIVYDATTCTPPAEVLATFPPLADDIKARRDPLRVRPVYRGDGKFYGPMLNIDKRRVAQMYSERRVLFSLFPLTCSCEAIFDLASDVHHCGECWWCKEREWGFGRL